ncbi:sigma-70 family RNA polymerase sigma factor [Rubinisphaera margarita]|uniref:sigma-70 family RNA polymerase sigma factor n=1 Tax=Rubinisphaera margarita TaxID=2909586 RepID=UPI001EE7FD35|nr:sigma-70 family RNA polymerase sigma factor [Rubinisphaera margarita]MCG6155724.1 sigma-70 family RNA polymerase sigma factor [Rubinisphaera margarita]
MANDMVNSVSASVRKFGQIDRSQNVELMVTGVTRSVKRKRMTSRRLKELAASLVEMEVDFIPDKRYQEQNAAAEFQNDDVFEYLETTPPERKDNLSHEAYEMASRVAQMPLLSPTNEQKYFSQMNYLKFRFNQLRSRIDPDQPDRKLVLEADRTIRQAYVVRDLLIRSNMRLVISVTKKFVTSQMSFDELFSDGVLALMQAVEKFDIGRGYRFSTYAYYSVSRSMYRFTRRLRKRMLTVDTFDRDLSDEKPAEALWPEQTWSTVSQTLAEMITHLDEREQWIIRQRFSLDGPGKTPTYKALAEKLGVCNERVRQLEKRALLKLRNMQESIQLDDLVATMPV